MFDMYGLTWGYLAYGTVFFLIDFPPAYLTLLRKNRLTHVYTQTNTHTCKSNASSRASGHCLIMYHLHCDYPPKLFMALWHKRTSQFLIFFLNPPIILNHFTKRPHPPQPLPCPVSPHTPCQINAISVDYVCLSGYHQPWFASGRAPQCSPFHTFTESHGNSLSLSHSHTHTHTHPTVHAHTHSTVTPLPLWFEQAGA